jgi:exopolysaccharide production protein ExoQ
MPGPVALFGCVLFVLVLLRRESKESTIGVTNYLWVPTAWFLILATRSLAMWFGTGGATIEEGSVVDQVVNFGLFGLALATLIKRHFIFSAALRANKWLAFMLAFMLLSTLWSEISFVSFRRWCTYAIALIMILSVQTEPQPRVAAESILRRIVYICIPFSYLLIHYYQQYGKIYVHTEGIEMWTGVAIHKNSLAELCLISFLLLIWRLATRKKEKDEAGSDKIGLYLDLGVLLITLLVFMGPERRITYSATTLMATMIGIGTLAFFRWHRRRGTQPAATLLIAGTAFLIVYGTITPFLGKLSLLDVSSALGRSSSLTGRTEVWASLQPAVMEQPFVGYGVGGFWTTRAREIYDISGAHNGFLGVILEGGFAGLIFMTAFIFSITKAAHNLLKIDENWAALSSMFLFAILSHNIGEESINAFTSRLTSVLLLLNVSCHGTASVTQNSMDRFVLIPG